MSLVNFFFPLLLLLPEQKRVLDFTRQEMEEHALKTFADIGDDEELGPADWSTVNRYLTCLHIPEYEAGRAEREREGREGGEGKEGGHGDTRSGRSAHSRSIERLMQMEGGERVMGEGALGKGEEEGRGGREAERGGGGFRGLLEALGKKILPPRREEEKAVGKTKELGNGDNGKEGGWGVVKRWGRGVLPVGGSSTGEGKKAQPVSVKRRRRRDGRHREQQQLQDTRLRFLNGEESD